MTTKEQERTALNKIRNILGTLDADGWVNTAFKGVCDIAARNIDDDFADSPVERVEELEKELDNAEKREISWKADAERYKGEYDALNETYRIISAQGMKHKNAIETVIQHLENGIEELNTTILKHCENPKSPEFVNAVSARKETKRLLDTLTDAL